LDATKIPDLATSAPIQDTDNFRKQVAIVTTHHPNGALLKDYGGHYPNHHQENW